MSQEIIEAVRTIEREKGIESDTLVHALEDALLAAYKKTPGAARHARVVLDEESSVSFRFRSHEISRCACSTRRWRRRSTSWSGSRRSPARSSTR
jgi:hypothetical protein